MTLTLRLTASPLWGPRPGAQGVWGCRTSTTQAEKVEATMQLNSAFGPPTPRRVPHKPARCFSPTPPLSGTF